MSMSEFLKNRRDFSPAVLDSYAGQYVAWSPDGKQILAADPDPTQLVSKVKAAGHDPRECVLSSVPASEEVILGGGLDE